MQSSPKKIAVCDTSAFLPLRQLILGPLESTEDLLSIECFLRTVLLHDEIILEFEPIKTQPALTVGTVLQVFPTSVTEGPGKKIAFHKAALCVGVDISEFGFFGELETDSHELAIASSLVDATLNYTCAKPDESLFQAHMTYLGRVLSIVYRGGSALLSSDFGRAILDIAAAYPKELFEHLDTDWQQFASKINEDGLGLLVPPLTGMVLTRCARREAIPLVIRELREEWADARRRLWTTLEALRVSRSLDEAQEIRREISEASRLFSPLANDCDIRPVRVLWDIVAGVGAGAIVAHLSGGKPILGAATGGIAQAARSVPAFVHDFGAALFGRGAFDLARRVRRAVSEIELDALPRLLSDAEKQKLGFK